MTGDVGDPRYRPTHKAPPAPARKLVVRELTMRELSRATSAVHEVRSAVRGVLADAVGDELKRRVWDMESQRLLQGRHWR